jgi:hypothetical protein
MKSTFLLLTLVGCGSAVVAKTAAHNERREHLLRMAVPDWVKAAERESSQYMTNRCHHFAPLTDVYDGESVHFSEFYNACLLRESIAVAEAWRPHVEEALAKCKATGKECCVGTTSSNAITNTFWLRECNISCEASIGHAPTPYGLCLAKVIDEPVEFEASHRTPAVRAITSQCDIDSKTAQACGTLPTIAEKNMCAADCQRSDEQRYFDAQVKACVAGVSGSGKLPRCTFEHPLELTGQTMEQCGRECARISGVPAVMPAAPAGPRSD